MSEPRHPLPDTALDADIAILGKKGRGKAFTAKASLNGSCRCTAG